MLSKINFSSIIIIVLVVGFSIVFNTMVINIRLQEADYHLHKVALNQFAQNTFLISSKYALIKKRMEEGESQVENYQFEGQVQAILSEEQSTFSESSYTPLSAYHPVSIVLNVLREILGKENLILPLNNSSLSRDLEISFYLERNRNYSAAIENYDKILADRDLDKSLYTSILLHKAFCLSMQGELLAAVDLYGEIYDNYPETDAGLISKEMKDFVLSLIEKNRIIVEESRDDLFIGKQLYYNMSYSEALPYLDEEINKELESSQPEARYFKGRILEELGQYMQATMEYHKLMYLNPENEWCIAANRRLMMLGTIYNQNHPLLESAESNLAKMNDTLFLNSVESMTELLVTTDFEDTLKEQFLEEPLLIDDSILTTLEVKFEFEQTPVIEDTVEEVQEEVPVVREIVTPIVREVPVETRRELTEAEKIEQTRRLANSEYRKATFIRQTINSQTSRLQQIYLEYANSGEPIDGEIIVEMKIAASGSIDASILRSDISHSEFKRRVVQDISQWSFPAIEDDLGTLTISYPFNFAE